MKWVCSLRTIWLGCLFLFIGMTNAHAAGSPPTISGSPAATVNENESYSFLPTASDPDGETLSFSLSANPSWMIIDTNTGAVSGTPGYDDGGTYTGISITVSDGDLTGSMNFDVQVVNVNRAPTISGSPAATVNENASYSFLPTASDPDGDTLSFSLSANPAWMIIDTNTGAVSGIPGYDDEGTYMGVTLTVSDGDLTDFMNFDVQVINVNRPPTISGTPNTMVIQDAAYSFVPTASDADMDPITFSITNQPAWASFNTTTGELSGTPTNADVGTTIGIVIRVSDGTVNPALPSFNIEVVNTNDKPIISGTPPTSVAQGATYNFQPTATDPDGDPLIWAINNEPSWLSIDRNTGSVTGTPGSGDVGITSNIVISVTDGDFASSLPAFSLTVTNVNDAPVIGGAPGTMVVQDTLYNFTPTATDADGDVLTFSITNKPSWTSFNTSTGNLSGTPSNADVGTTTGIVIRASDGTVSTALPSFDIQVTDTNDPPIISGTPPTSVAQGNPYSFQPTASDPDGDPLVWAINNEPTWLSISSTTGLVSGTPGSGDVGTTSNIVISVTDGAYARSLPGFNLTVSNVNDPPVISGTPDTMVVQDTAYQFIPTASDADGDVLTFSITNRPTWTLFNSTTGALTGTPSNADVGTTTGISISVSDGTASIALPSFFIEVTNANDPPAISGSPATSVAQNTLYSFSPTASDPDGDTLTFDVINEPSWLMINASTGLLSGTPGSGDIGTTNGIAISVTDGLYISSLPVFNLTVTNINDAPVISGSPPTKVAQDAPYNFVPTATDVDGDPLSFSITGKPSWASFNLSTGALTGTPANTDVGTSTGIVISVTDGSSTASLPAFSIEVTNANDPPTISGAPASTVAQNSLYQMQATASDPDGDPLTFSAANIPSWLNMNQTSGLLSGTPGSGDVGTYSNIIVSVTDGGYTISLPAFNLTVTNVNDSPVISGTPATTVTQDNNYNFTPTASDPDGQTLTFSISNAPSWASFDSSTGSLFGTPTNTDVGTTTGIGISVSDGALSASLPLFNIQVLDTNEGPVISGLPTTNVAQDMPYSFTPTASDPEGDTLSFSIVNKPGWANFNTSNGTLSGTPALADVATYLGIVISVTDGEFTASLPSFNLVVVGAATPVVFISTDQAVIKLSDSATLSWDSTNSDTVVIDQGIGSVALSGSRTVSPATSTEYTATATGQGGTISHSVLVDVAYKTIDSTFDSNEENFNYYDDTYTTTPNPTNASGAYSSGALHVELGPGNTGGECAGGWLNYFYINEDNTTVTVSLNYRMVLTSGVTSTEYGRVILDVDGVKYGSANGPSIVQRSGNGTSNVDTGSQNASFDILLNQGFHFFSVGAYSAGIASASGSVQVDFDNISVNAIPAFVSTPLTGGLEDTLYSYTPVVKEDDGDPLTFALTGAPSGMSFNSANGQITWTPLNGVTSSGPLVLSVNDGNGGSDSQSFTITVGAVNDPPTISGTPATEVNQDEFYEFLPTAADQDGDTLKFVVLNKPNWLSFETATGRLYGTPDNTNTGVFPDIQISVNDDVFFVALPAFDLTVININDPPLISGTPKTVVVQNDNYLFIPEASDPDGDPLSFTISNPPVWCSFDPSTGALYGRPENEHVGTTSGIVISVTDSTEIVSLPAFDLRVAQFNDPPVISGSPETTVSKNSAYSFTPDASDIDGDVLTFSAVNLPSWLTIDPATGKISGSPSTGDVGVFAGIVVSVTDGLLTASLDPFDLTVINHPPMAIDVNISLQEDIPYNGSLNASDADFDILSYALVTDGTLGNVIITDVNAGFFTYTPLPNLNGPDTFTFEVTDGQDTSNIGTVSVVVEPVNDIPAITSTAPTMVNSGTAYHYAPTVNEVDGDTLTWTLTSESPLPLGFTFDTGTGTIDWPDTDKLTLGASTGQLTVTVNDGELEDSETFEIVVVDTPDPNNTVIAINAGGPEYISSGGTTYLADSDLYYTGGSIWGAEDTPIDGTKDYGLYQTTRYEITSSSFSYAFPLPSGTYLVTLKMVELYYDSTGAQTFNVTIEGTQVLTDLDIFAEVGQFAAYDQTFTTTVTDGELNIVFQGTTNSASVSAIRIAQ